MWCGETLGFVFGNGPPLGKYEKSRTPHSCGLLGLMSAVVCASRKLVTMQVVDHTSTDRRRPGVVNVCKSLALTDGKSSRLDMLVQKDPIL